MGLPRSGAALRGSENSWFLNCSCDTSVRDAVVSAECFETTEDVISIVYLLVEAKAIASI